MLFDADFVANGTSTWTGPPAQPPEVLRQNSSTEPAAASRPFRLFQLLRQYLQRTDHSLITNTAVQVVALATPCYRSTVNPDTPACYAKWPFAPKVQFNNILRSYDLDDESAGPEAQHVWSHVHSVCKSPFLTPGTEAK